MPLDGRNADLNSETAKKAFADLIEYKAIRAKHEADFEELCSRPSTSLLM